MTTVSLSMHALWENALGANWKKKISAEKLKSIYQKI
jgi:3-deoxy-alpha-D-manno-octulosonate 8-oxidase